MLTNLAATCAVCGKSFARRSTMQTVCGSRCAAKSVKTARKAEREQLKRRKDAIKTRSGWLKEAQAAFNAYIRERDRALPCICCGRWAEGESRGGVWDCGHYRSTGSAPHLRFSEINSHRQLKQCNRWGAGRAVDYRIGLIARIGLPAVEALEADQTPRKWTIDDLKAIRDLYRAKLKELKA